jgi:hypothetical protein
MGDDNDDARTSSSILAFVICNALSSMKLPSVSALDKGPKQCHGPTLRLVE